MFLLRKLHVWWLFTWQVIYAQESIVLKDMVSFRLNQNRLTWWNFSHSVSDNIIKVLQAANYENKHHEICMKEQAAQAWLILFLNGFVLFIFLCLILRDVALILDTWKEMFVCVWDFIHMSIKWIIWVWSFSDPNLFSCRFKKKH